MTSNTTPSGLAFASNYDSNREAYRAFNSTLTEGPYWQSTTSSGAHVGYKFTNPVCVKAFDYEIYYNPSIVTAHQITVKGSNDGTNWVDIQSYDIPANTGKQTYKLKNNAKYLYYILAINPYNTSAGSKACDVWTLQFYGR